MRYPLSLFRASLLALFALGTGLGHAAERPAPPRDGSPPWAREFKGESHLISRDDRQILTYETEEQLRALDELYAKSQAAKPEPGCFVMRFIRARTDGSIQPYGFWLPHDYAPDRKFALLVQLHGIGPEFGGGRRQVWPGQGVREWIDPNEPVIVVQPFGRSNSFYQGIAEDEVMQIIDEVMQTFSVDADRVYIMGHSMGGAGSWMIGLHYPDRFGGIMPIDAAMGFDDAVSRPETLPAWMQPQVVMFKQDNLFPNARNVPVFLKNAGAGIQKTSTRYSDGVVAEGGFATMESFPGLPHHFAPQYSYEMFTGEVTVHPIERHPREVKFFTNTLRYDRAYWITLDRLEQSNVEARIDAIYDDGLPHPAPAERRPQARTEEKRPPSLSITTKNLDAITLRLDDAGVPADAALHLEVDGVEISSSAWPAVVSLAKQAGNWQRVAVPARSAKHHGIQGPIGDAFTGPFLAVYGEGDLPLATAELDAFRNPPGRLILQADIPLARADAVTSSDIADRNLILFGTEKTNPIIARLAARLPSQLMHAAESDSAVVFIYPNPENPARYVVIWTGRILSAPLDVKIEAGWMQPINLLPDYVVATHGRIERAGFFDRDWR